MEYTSDGATSPLGQKVEFRTYIREGHSRAEREAAVVVSGRGSRTAIPFAGRRP